MFCLDLVKNWPNNCEDREISTQSCRMGKQMKIRKRKKFLLSKLASGKLSKPVKFWDKRKFSVSVTDRFTADFRRLVCTYESPSVSSDHSKTGCEVRCIFKPKRLRVKKRKGVCSENRVRGDVCSATLSEMPLVNIRCVKRRTSGEAVGKSNPQLTSQDTFDVW